MGLPTDPFGRTRLPAAHDRVERVRLSGEVAQALLEGRVPSRQAALFVGGALLGYLESDTKRPDLARDFLRIKPERGSNWTPQAIWRKWRNGKK
jgi:hypothetical protein